MDHSEMARRRWPLTSIERFLSYVQVGDTPDACWIWTGTRTGRGYGSFTVQKRQTAAHRWAYEHYVGPIPTGMDLCHTCDVRLCVNVAHLFPGSRADNMADASRKGRTTQGQRNAQAKLTESQVRFILDAPRVRGGAVRLAAAFGVSPTLVRLIQRRKRWAHVTA